jgi:hypothetical protein
VHEIILVSKLFLDITFAKFDVFLPEEVGFGDEIGSV